MANVVTWASMGADATSAPARDQRASVTKGRQRRFVFFAGRDRTTVTRTAAPLATFSRSVARRFPKDTALVHGDVSPAATLARHAHARSLPFGARLARFSVIRTVRSRTFPPATAARATPLTDDPTVAEASATPVEVRSTAVPPRAANDDVAAVAECTGPIHALAHETTVPPGPVAVSEPRISAPASASVST
jgi:hypothetical protein